MQLSSDFVPRVSITHDASVRAFYHQRKILVVGADGFLGINCVYALHELGADITILTRRPTPRAVGFAGRVFQGDLRDYGLVRSMVDDQTIVFDFAGVSGAVQSNKTPLRSLQEDCYPHLSLLHACACAHTLPLVVFCSSRLVYGKPQYLPVDESHPLASQSLYAVHKITVENYLRVFSHTHGLRYCILRLSNPYGPYQPQELRSYGIINQFICMASKGMPIKIYGAGEQQRDYIYVDDAISTFLLCAMHTMCHDQVFNLGGRNRISIRTAVQQIAQLAGDTPVYFEPWPKDYKSVETGDYYTDLSKIDSCLTLPAQMPFEEGLARTISFYRSLLKV